MKDWRRVLASARSPTGPLLQLIAVAVGFEHFEPGILGMRGQVLGGGPIDPVSGRFAGVVQDIRADALEAGPPFLEARHHGSQSSF